jgi:histidyl-tRNA synthetase
VLITTLDPEATARYLAIAAELRAADVNTEVYLERAKIAKQFEYANKKGFRIALTAGADEFSRGSVKLKDLARQVEADVPQADVAARVKEILYKAN